MISPDGAIVFVMKRTRAGVHMERTHVRSPSSRVSHAMMFASPEEFDRFCEADDVRFQYPIVYQQIKRECHELFGLEA